MIIGTIFYDSIFLIERYEMVVFVSCIFVHALVSQDMNRNQGRSVQRKRWIMRSCVSVSRGVLPIFSPVPKAGPVATAVLPAMRAVFWNGRILPGALACDVPFFAAARYAPALSQGGWGRPVPSCRQPGRGPASRHISQSIS